MINSDDDRSELRKNLFSSKFILKNYNERL